MKAQAFRFQGITKPWVTVIICETFSNRDYLTLPIRLAFWHLHYGTVCSETSISLSVRAVKVTLALKPSAFKNQLRCLEEDAVMQEWQEAENSSYTQITFPLMKFV